MLTKTTVPFLSLLLVVWIGLCTYLNMQCCQTSVVTSPSLPLTIQDGETLITEAAKGMTFGFANNNLAIPESTNVALNQLVTYLNQNPAKLLVLTGKMTTEETTVGENPNLGRMRASYLRDELIELGALHYHIAIKESLTDSLNIEDGYVLNAIDFEFFDFPILIEDGANFRFSENNNIRFSFSDYLPNISDTVRDGLQKLATYLKENQNKTLILTGLYTLQEENSSILSDLGFARANAIQNELIELDVPPNRIEIKSREDRNLEIFDVVIIGGVEFAFD